MYHCIRFFLLVFCLLIPLFARSSERVFFLKYIYFITHNRNVIRHDSERRWLRFCATRGRPNVWTTACIRTHPARWPTSGIAVGLYQHALASLSSSPIKFDQLNLSLQNNNNNNKHNQSPSLYYSFFFSKKNYYL